MRIRKRIKYLLIALTAIIAGGTVYARVSSAEAESNRRKARYFYMEGARLEGEGLHAEAHEFYKRAYETDPTYPEAAYTYGYSRLYIPGADMQNPAERKRSLQMMRKYIEAYPEDIDELLNYGFMTLNLDTVEETLRVLDRAISRDPSNSSILALLSEAYTRSGEYKKAAQALEQFGKIEGARNPQVALRIMSNLLSASDTMGAIAVADRFIGENPYDPSFRIIKGNLYDVLERPDDALRMYLEADSLAPESGMPKLALADFYMNQGDSVAFDRNLIGLLLADDLEFDQKHDLLASYLQDVIRGDRDTSHGDYLFGVLSEQYPHRAEMRDLAARYAAAKMDFDKAAEEISYAIDQDPANEIYWGQLMTYHLLSNDSIEKEKALTDYDEALKFVAPSERLRRTKAAAALTLKKYDVARGIFEEELATLDSALLPLRPLTLKDVRPNISLEELDKVSELLTEIGDVYYSQENLDSAFMMYEGAIELNSSNWEAKNNYAYFLSLKGKDLEKAYKLISSVIDSPEGENPTYVDTYAWILHLMGRNEDAEIYQRKAIADTKERGLIPSPELYDHLIEILQSEGKEDEALEFLVEGLEANPDGPGDLEKKIKVMIPQGEDPAEYLERRRGVKKNTVDVSGEGEPGGK